MAKPNYSFEKRQRELAKKRKKEEKQMRKTTTRDAPAEPGAAAGAEPLPPTPPGDAPAT